MKTIKDAYEALKGNLSNTYMPDVCNDDKYLFFHSGEIGYILDSTNDDEGGKYQYICTVEEFNNYEGENVKTIKDAVIYYRGDYFMCGVNKRHHTHVISIHNSTIIGTAYASDIGMNAIICGIKTYNEYVDLLASNFGKAKQTYAEYKELYNSVFTSSEKPVYTQAMADNGELPMVGAMCQVNKRTGIVAYLGEGIVVIKHCCGEVAYQKSETEFKPLPIDQRTKKEKAIDDLCHAMEMGCGSPSSVYKRYSKPVIDAIIAGKINGVTFNINK